MKERLGIIALLILAIVGLYLLRRRTGLSSVTMTGTSPGFTGLITQDCVDMNGAHFQWPVANGPCPQNPVVYPTSFVGPLPPGGVYGG